MLPIVNVEHPQEGKGTSETSKSRAEITKQSTFSSHLAPPGSPETVTTERPPGCWVFSLTCCSSSALWRQKTVFNRVWTTVTRNSTNHILGTAHFSGGKSPPWVHTSGDTLRKSLIWESRVTLRDSQLCPVPPHHMYMHSTNHQSLRPWKKAWVGGPGVRGRDSGHHDSSHER